MYLYICKVVYVGIDPAIKPGEWVPATRLRPQMAAPNFKNAAWRGWEVSDGATGEYIKDKFAPLPAQQVVSNEVVECLLPFSGRKEDGPVHVRKAEPPPPRLLDVAAAVTAPSAALLFYTLLHTLTHTLTHARLCVYSEDTSMQPRCVCVAAGDGASTAARADTCVCIHVHSYVHMYTSVSV